MRNSITRSIGVYSTVTLLSRHEVYTDLKHIGHSRTVSDVF